ncbi:hypothetical protein LCGC14_0493040 [marine sediment metagenome]|uniref:HD Cas3-type domain-containing protein n=1 Tax=marine sediment metagenome TaxID=412755 RepID=A0A0F9UT15_9ZZZZ|nr:CRISPR-associated helicase Cas3' [archaeon]
MTALKHIWGKAKRITLEGENTYLYHPLICHLIDVAAVAEIYWDKILTGYVKTKISQYLGRSQEKSKRWLIFLAGIHDIGKATPVFQGKVPALAKKLESYNLNIYTRNISHSFLSGEIFYSVFSNDDLEMKIKDLDLLYNLKYVLGGHHGIFPTSSNISVIIPEHLGTEKWREIQLKLIGVIKIFSGLSQKDNIEDNGKINLLNPEHLKAFIIFLTGLICVVDWIGSNDQFFEYFIDFTNTTELIDKYFPLSRKRAKNAIKKIGWDNWKPMEKNKVLLFEEVFPFIKELRPLQKTIVDNLDLFISPCLVIIEAPMGEGKTEAALYLEHYLDRSQDLQGSYLALPTQATANQMFTRVKKFLLEINLGQRVNLHLLHGNAVINEKYELLKIKSRNFDQYEPIVADDWFTYRKRGLIAPFGVGTIDQILLSVLPVRHFFVRLFGLAGKIVIIDEVHSYDVYMSKILENLLYWLKLLGSSVILLSATLPSFKRKKLIETFNDNHLEYKDQKYPRISLCSDNRILVKNIEVSLKKQGDESICIHWIEENCIEGKIKKILQNGGRVAIVCNKVKRAQNFYLKLMYLENSGIKIYLLHSRFPYNQRMEIENSIIETFGINKDHTEESKLLISTQIIEQSLDLDFDLMISDLAPIDLLFQRMGRLHRHIRDREGNHVLRPELLKRPQFWIIQPALNEYRIPQIPFPIYSKYILQKTYLNLKSVKKIEIPDDLERFIEIVYEKEESFPKEFTDVRTEWKRELEKSKQVQNYKDREKAQQANYRLIPNPEDDDFFEDFYGYLEENTSKAQKALQLMTRITSPSIQLLCLYQSSEDQLFFDEKQTIPIDITKKPNKNGAKKILDYSIRVSSYPIVSYFTTEPNSIPKSWKKNTLTRNIHHVILSREESTDYFYFNTEKNQIYLRKKIGLYNR